MAKTQAPLFGFGASGQLGQAVVYGSWKGINVARRYVVPSNPQSTLQTVQRGYFTDAVDSWHGTVAAPFSAADVEAWNRYAGTLGPLSGFNAYVRWFTRSAVLFGASALHRLRDNLVTDLTYNSFDTSVKNTLGGVTNVTMFVGRSTTFFGSSFTVAMVAGTATFANVDLSAFQGQRIYFYFVGVDSAGQVIRTGVYTAQLTS